MGTAQIAAAKRTVLPEMALPQRLARQLGGLGQRAARRAERGNQRRQQEREHREHRIPTGWLGRLVAGAHSAHGDV